MRATLAALALCLLLAAPAGAATLSPSGAPSGDVATQTPAHETTVHYGSGPSENYGIGPSENYGSGPRESVHAGAFGAVAQDQGGAGLATPETIDVQIRDDGHARFTIVKEFPAETESERTAFDRVAEEFERGQHELGLSFFSTVVDDVSEETGRPMELTETSRRTPVDDGTGRLIQQFTWTNYAAVTEDSVEIQDGFHTDDGVWLHSLEPDQELVLRAPEGYGVAHSEPKSSVRGNTVIWEGPQTFERGDFRTVFERSQSPFGNGIGDASLLLGVIGVLLLLLTGYLLLRRLQREGVLDVPGLPTRSRLAGSIPGGSSERTDDGAGGTEQSTGDAEASATNPDASDAEAATDEESADGDDEVDPELLSDEERVERLLERNGGRMKQAKIVDETGWSNAKVSQLLSEMAEQEKIDKLRIGRENLITLPDEDVTAME